MTEKPASRLKLYLQTFIYIIKLAWQTNPLNFSIMIACSATTGILILPNLFLTQNLVNSIAAALVDGQIQTHFKIVALTTAGLFTTGVIGSYVDNVIWTYRDSLSRQLTESISVSISNKLNKLSITSAEDPETRNILRKILDNTGRSVWGMIEPIADIPSIIFGLISSLFFIAKFNIIIIIPASLIAIPQIIIGIKRSKALHQLRSKNSSYWRLYWAFDEFTSKGKYIYENKILDHVDKLTTKRQKLGLQMTNREFQTEKYFDNRRQVVVLPREIFVNGIRLWLYYSAIIKNVTLGFAQSTSSAISTYINNFSWLIRISSTLYQHHLFINDYRSFLNLAEEENPGSIMIPKTLKTGLEFKDVWFKYPNSNNWILKGVSFKIEPMQNMAIVGVNGVGKSTLVRLICRFYKPNKGHILLNDQPIENYDLKSYRHSIAALFQDFVQYPFSGSENISFGDINQKHNFKNIKGAAKLADIDPFLSTLPKGYKTPLDKEFKGGVDPSKGQWQRIALARALYRNSPLIILDEPTSNVDPETEEIIFERILNVTKDKCVILVSHRFSTVKKADTILVLENGQVAEIGSHQTLLNNRGTYHKLFTLQAKSYS